MIICGSVQRDPQGAYSSLPQRMTSRPDRRGEAPQELPARAVAGGPSLCRSLHARREGAARAAPRHQAGDGDDGDDDLGAFISSEDFDVVLADFAAVTPDEKLRPIGVGRVLRGTTLFSVLDG